VVKDQINIDLAGPEDRPVANILVVDDRRSNLVALEAILAPLGENVVLATSGREALRFVLQMDFAVILMDVQMPELDGLETVAMIRERPASRHIPIIFITALNTDEERICQGYSVGAVDYITKPFNPTMLASKVSVFVELFKKEKLLNEQAAKIHETELTTLRMKQRQREQQLEQDRIREVNRLLEVRVQERTAELEAFCYSVSHDLRTPLRSIDGYSATMEEDMAGRLSDESENYLRRIRSAAKKMDELISALLSLSRITRVELRPSPIDVAELARGIVGELKGIDGREIEVEIQNHMIANGDPALIRSLLLNLIGNAWKFTSESTSPRIEIGTYLDDNDQVVYFVKDNGIGFNPTYKHKLFQPFERLHTLERYPGCGIGLATVLRIVRKHGGDVWAEGEEGKGAEFYFTL
jgi:two-component system sensor histidine kinase/response regulator